MKTYLLELVLVDSKPKIWRYLKLPGRYKLNQIHGMMQILFAWEDYHLHDFQFGDTRYTNLEQMLPEYDMGEEDEKISLNEALGSRKTFHYRYDFGDSWEVRARVKSVEEGDLDSPECLAGERAGPPEDCGGVWGLSDLIAVLKDKKHPEYDSTRTWVGKRYDPAKFKPESVNKALKRKYGRKPKKKKVPKDAVLSGYYLSKLKRGQMIVAALEEKSPRTLEEIAERLESLGVHLPKGVETLRRAIGQSDALRQRTDGAIELTDDAAHSETTRFMSIYKVDFGKPATPPEPVPPKVGPLTVDELVQANLAGITVKRTLLTCAVDALGGSAGLEEALDLLKPLSGLFDRGVDLSISLRGAQHLKEVDGVLQLDQEHKKTEEVRKEIRERIPDHTAERLRREYFAQRQQKKQNERLQTRDEFQKARKAIIAGVPGSAYAILDSANHQLHSLEPDEVPALLTQFDYLIGLDPKTTLEREGWDLELACVDITPPFKSIAVGRGRRKTVPVDKAIKMSLGRSVDPKGWKKLAKEKKKLEKQLVKDVETLYYLWRYGVIHGGLMRGWEHVPVTWNVGLELKLRHTIEFSQRKKSPLHLVRKNRFAGAFLPHQLHWNYEDSFVDGVWVESNAPERLKLVDVIDFSYDFELSDEEFLEYANWL